jgi:hypothetical protein
LDADNTPDPGKPRDLQNSDDAKNVTLFLNPRVAAIVADNTTVRDDESTMESSKQEIPNCFDALMGIENWKCFDGFTSEDARIASDGVNNGVLLKTGVGTKRAVSWNGAVGAYGRLVR